MTSARVYDPDRLIARVIDSPHNKHLGLTVVERRPAETLVRMPIRPELIGDPDQGVLHGGPLTVLLDATFVVATYLALDRPVPIATIDLRVDYFKPVRDGAALFAACRCERLTRDIAFLRGHVYVDRPDAVVAMATSAYMLATREGGK